MEAQIDPHAFLLSRNYASCRDTGVIPVPQGEENLSQDIKKVLNALVLASEFLSSGLFIILFLPSRLLSSSLLFSSFFLFSRLPLHSLCWRWCTQDLTYPEHSEHYHKVISLACN